MRWHVLRHKKMSFLLLLLLAMASASPLMASASKKKSSHAAQSHPSKPHAPSKASVKTSAKSKSGSKTGAKRSQTSTKGTAPSKSHSGSSSTYRQTKGRKSASSARVQVHYAAPRVDSTQRATRTDEINSTLKEPASTQIAYSSALHNFYSQLAAHEGNAQEGTVRVLQFGDSHTAADMFTGEARRVFQQQFGDGGIGYAYAGHPFAGYRILGSHNGQSSGWVTMGNKFQKLGDARTGMGGLSISTDRQGEWVTLSASCTSLDFEYLKQPGGGRLTFTDNGGNPIEIRTGDDAISAGSFHYDCPQGDHEFEVRTQSNAPVTLLGWVATQPGVTWEAMGINGAQAPLILKWDQQLFSDYLKENNPALVVLAYGTNEASSSYWDTERYEDVFASIIDSIHRYVPEASILVIGPPDRSTGAHRRWSTFLGVSHIIEAQRTVCRTHGCAFWDQRQRMGGPGAMQKWVYAGLAQPDHTHLTGTGYRAMADALMKDLITGYQNYKEHTAPHTETAMKGTMQ